MININIKIMLKAFNFRIALLLLAVSVNVEVVHGDLPVHCLRSQIVGDWTFMLSKSSARRSSCGHLRPDTPAGQPST